MELDNLGFKFWARLAGLFLVGAIVAFVVMLILLRAIYAWGFLGAILGLLVVFLVIAWFHDRREQRRASSY